MSAGGDDGKVEETEYEKELGRIGVETWNIYQDDYLPLENRLFGEVRTTRGEMDQATGWANAASEQQFAGARDAQRENLFAGGFDPSSGGFVARTAGLAADEALATGMSEVNSGQAMSDQEVYGLQGLTQIGQGQNASALQQYGQVASSAQDQAISDARNALNERLATQQTVGSVAGAATAYKLNKPTQGASLDGLDTSQFNQYRTGSGAVGLSTSNQTGTTQSLGDYAAGGYGS